MPLLLTVPLDHLLRTIRPTNMRGVGVSQTQDCETAESAIFDYFLSEAQQWWMRNLFDGGDMMSAPAM
jgi:hypothetical protein